MDEGLDRQVAAALDRQLGDDEAELEAVAAKTESMEDAGRLARRPDDRDVVREPAWPACLKAIVVR